jgi:repressor LexA
MHIDIAKQKISTFYREYRRMPSYQEMCYLFGFASKKASFTLAQKLISAGFLKKDERGRLSPQQLLSEIPFLGSIKAGFPTAAEEQLYETMSFDRYLVDRPEKSFVLKVSGDSMIEAGIYPGDLVIIEKLDISREPKEGSIVVAQVDNEWTLKYFQIKNGQACLVPANPKYPIIYPEESLSIWGVVTSVIRKYQ